MNDRVRRTMYKRTAKERVIDPATIEWTPPARPFFWVVRGYGAPGRTQAPNSHADFLDY